MSDKPKISVSLATLESNNHIIGDTFDFTYDKIISIKSINWTNIGGKMPCA